MRGYGPTLRFGTTSHQYQLCPPLFVLRMSSSISICGLGSSTCSIGPQYRKRQSLLEDSAWEFLIETVSAIQNRKPAMSSDIRCAIWRSMKHMLMGSICIETAGLRADAYVQPRHSNAYRCSQHSKNTWYRLLQAFPNHYPTLTAISIFKPVMNP